MVLSHWNALCIPNKVFFVMSIILTVHILRRDLCMFHKRILTLRYYNLVIRAYSSLAISTISSFVMVALHMTSIQILYARKQLTIFTWMNTILPFVMFVSMCKYIHTWEHATYLFPYTIPMSRFIPTHDGFRDTVQNVDLKYTHNDQ